VYLRRGGIAQARHRDSPPSSDLNGRTELSRATQAVESVGVQTDAPGGFRNRNEIGGRVLSTDLFERRERQRRSRGHGSPSFFGPEGPSLSGPGNRHICPRPDQTLMWQCHRRSTASSRRLGSQQLLAVSRSFTFALRANPPEVLARPRGLPHRDWTPLAAGGGLGHANNAAASFATNEASCVPPGEPDRAPGLGADARWPPARARIGILRRTNLWPRRSVPMGQWLRPARWLTSHRLKRSVRVNEGAAGCGR
jgi:hypothetical protein